jgi:hypothetical protein
MLRFQVQCQEDPPPAPDAAGRLGTHSRQDGPIHEDNVGLRRGIPRVVLEFPPA